MRDFKRWLILLCATCLTAGLGGCEGGGDGQESAADSPALTTASPSGMSTLSQPLDPSTIPKYQEPLDPSTIPKYQEPLVIPPVMPPQGQGGLHARDGAPTLYQIAVRQFSQQILPPPLPATTVWSYGSFTDPMSGPQANATFNYPAFTVETRTDQTVRVRWVNQLVDRSGNFLPHLLPVDQTLHWANPPQDCIDGPSRTDCRGDDPSPYRGPVPIVTHVHGAHVDPVSDGYPEAWWLPNARNIPAGYATRGSNYGSVIPAPPGSAWFEYDNSQPAATLWFHDHTLGMTRSNVYAGPAGFWLIRDEVEDGLGLPGPAPVLGESVADLNTPGNPVRAKIREIPLAVQDRSFNVDGSLFYPADRAFFEGLAPEDLDITFIPDLSASGVPSDVSPIWNPEAFFETMVVNGRTWPVLEVEPDLYRLRFLNGCNSRFLILKLVTATDPDDPATWTDLPNAFSQIGAEGGLLDQVAVQDQLLLGPAERADVVVDFRTLAPGTAVYLVNIGPDEPFGGGTPGIDFDPADPATTGQVMKFLITADTDLGEEFTAVPTLPGITPLGAPDNVRQVSLNELDSEAVCAGVLEDGSIVEIEANGEGSSFEERCEHANPAPFSFVEGPFPFGPIAALLGTVEMGMGMPMMWSEPITESPLLNTVETWEIYNFTMDAHPIHLHLVTFQVLEREIIGEDSPNFDPAAGRDIGFTYDPAPSENGFKDTVIAFPGEITRIKALFDKAGLYVWHCHILEHEDNEMMRAYYVRADEGEIPPLP